jgi:hypothetical protein
LDTIVELMAGENLRFNDAEALARQFDHFPLAISFLLKNQWKTDKSVDGAAEIPQAPGAARLNPIESD